MKFFSRNKPGPNLRCVPCLGVGAFVLCGALQLQAQGLLEWDGNLNTNWDLATTANWLAAGTAVVFTNGASVSFADNAAGSGSVSLATALQPGSVTVSNYAKTYRLDGPGYVSASTAWAKIGTGRLVVSPGTRFVTSGSFNVAGGAVTIEGDSVGTNTIGGELWVGHTRTNAAAPPEEGGTPADETTPDGPDALD